MSRLFAEIAQRLGQAPLVGELVAGISLGLLAHQFSGALPELATLDDNAVFKGISDLAIFFLMMLAGMELRPKDMAEASGRAVGIAIGGMLLPVAMGLLLGYAWLPASDYRPAQAMFIAVALAVTAVPVAVRVLMDMGYLDSTIGRTIVSAAVIDDALSLVLLAILTAMIDRGSMPDSTGLLVIVGKVLLFFSAAIVIGQLIFPGLGRLLRRVQADEFEISMLLISGFAFSWLAELLGVHFILGAFLAGLFFGRRTVLDEVYESVRRRVTGITTGFFAPIFFAGIGLHLTGAALADIPLFVVLLILIAFLSKLIGAGTAARLSGMKSRDAMAAGTAMSARGAVELIIADVALRAGLFEVPEPTPVVVQNLFSAVVIMAVSTTITVPLVLKRLLNPSSRVMRTS